MRYSQIVLTSVTVSSSINVQAMPIPWDIANGGNGNSYEVIDTPLTWEDARQNALDQGGFLATVTDSVENTFINGLLDDQNVVSAWLGGSDRDQEGVWRWIDGPEAGTQFYQGDAKVGGSATAPFNYANWESGAPNGIIGDSDFLAMNSAGRWTSVAEDQGSGVVKLASVIEYENVPAPSTAVLALLGLAGIGSTRCRKKDATN